MTTSWRLPFVDISGYTLSDQTGEIVVLTERQPPLPKATVNVKARLDTIANVGTEVIGVHLVEIKRW